MKTLFLLAALVVGAWGQQQPTKLKDEGKIRCIDLKSDPAKWVPCYFDGEEASKGGNVWHPFDASVKSAFVYDLPAVKKTRRVCVGFEAGISFPLVDGDVGKDCPGIDYRTYFTCISPTLPPGLALVVSEDLTRGWCTGPRLKP